MIDCIVVVDVSLKSKVYAFSKFYYEAAVYYVITKKKKKIQLPFVYILGFIENKT